MSEPVAGQRPIPLSIPVLAGNEWAYVKECLDAGALTGGPIVDRFCGALGTLTGAPHVVPCSSGTAGLHLALLAVGVQPGDLVIVPTLTFAATANAVVLAGAEPVFVGCDDYLNMSPDVVRGFLDAECDGGPDGTVHRATGRRVAAMVPVHVFGNPCSLSPLLDTARAHGLRVVEDAAEAVGSAWTTGPLTGAHPGAVGDAGVLSFNGNKIITSGGGGAVLTRNQAWARRMAYLADQAKDDRVRFVHNETGYNYRLGALQAAVGLAQLERLDAVLEMKHANRQHYADRLSRQPGLRLLPTPPGTAPNHWFYPVIVESRETGRDRDALMAHLADAGIETRPIWYPNHLQRPFAEAPAYGIDKAVWYWERVLCLPCSVDLTHDDIDRVCDAIEAAS